MIIPILKSQTRCIPWNLLTLLFHPEDKKRRVWVDHILLSPHFYLQQVKGLQDGNIRAHIYKAEGAAESASDHYPVYCDLSFTAGSVTT